MKVWMTIIGGLAALTSRGAIEASYTASVFLAPDNTPYVEVLLGVETHTLKWTEAAGKWSAGCEVMILISDQTGIVNFDKFNLVTHPYARYHADSTFTLTCMRRIALDPGEYTLSIELTDLGDAGNKMRPEEVRLDARDLGEPFSLSDIQLLRDVSKEVREEGWFSKNGLYFKPQLYPFYPTEIPVMWFYAEAYDVKQAFENEDLLMLYMIRKKGWNEPVTGFASYSKQKGTAVNVALASFDLKDLPSGYYDLVVEVRTRNNELLADHSIEFLRSNKLSLTDLSNLQYLDVQDSFVLKYKAEEMPFFVRYLKPSASALEQRAIDDLLATGDMELMRKFLYNFWVTRDPQKPDLLWSNYLTMVGYVNERYSTVTRQGFETERGRVHLQYGPPNEVHESRFEAGTKPYEIWQYNIIPNNETNVIFVFYNPDLVSNDYRLIHSTATGEVYNTRWKVMLNESFEYEESKDFDNIRVRDRVGTQTYDVVPK